MLNENANVKRQKRETRIKDIWEKVIEKLKRKNKDTYKGRYKIK